MPFVEWWTNQPTTQCNITEDRNTQLQNCGQTKSRRYVLTSARMVVFEGFRPCLFHAEFRVRAMRGSVRSDAGPEVRCFGPPRMVPIGREMWAPEFLRVVQNAKLHKLWILRGVPFRAARVQEVSPGRHHLRWLLDGKHKTGFLDLQFVGFCCRSNDYFSVSTKQVNSAVMYTNKIPKDARVSRYLFITKSLYMFRVSIAPIIRSA